MKALLLFTHSRVKKLPKLLYKLGGVFSGGVPPDSIPNSEVKPASGENSAEVARCKNSSTPPFIFYEPCQIHFDRAFFLSFSYSHFYLMIQLLRRYYGILIFSLVSIYSTIRVLLEDFPGHYRIFTGAAKVLWSGHDPYDYDFHSVGIWFYSPSCGLFFYSWFAYLPEKIGLALYTIFSVLLVLSSLMMLMAYLFQVPLRKTFERPEMQLILMISSVQIFQAILASKLEMVIVAIMTISFLFQMRGWVWLPGLLLGMCLNWKLQPLPTVFLVSIFQWVVLRQWKPIFSTLISMGMWYLLPLIKFDMATLLALNHHMALSLSKFIPESFLNYDNFFKFVHAFGIPISYSQSLIMSIFAGACFALLSLMLSLKLNQLKELKNTTTTKDDSSFGLIQSRVYLMIFSLGNAFILMMSPMSQNNGSIMWLPILTCAGVTLFNPTFKWVQKTIWILILFFCFAYSDLIPDVLRMKLREYSLKSFVVMTLICFLVVIYYHSMSVLHLSEKENKKIYEKN